MYYRINRLDAFHQILSVALEQKNSSIDDRIEKRYLHDNEPKRVEALNSLAGYYLNLAEFADDQA